MQVKDLGANDPICGLNRAELLPRNLIPQPHSTAGESLL